MAVKTNNAGTMRHCYNNQEKPQAIPCGEPIRIETKKVLDVPKLRCSRTKNSLRKLDIGYLFSCSSARTNHCLTKLLLPHSCPVGVVPPSESEIPLPPVFYFLRTLSQLSLRLTDPTAVLEWTESKLELVVKVLFCFCI